MKFSLKQNELGSPRIEHERDFDQDGFGQNLSHRYGIDGQRFRATLAMFASSRGEDIISRFFTNVLLNSIRTPKR